MPLGIYGTSGKLVSYKLCGARIKERRSNFMAGLKPGSTAPKSGQYRNNATRKEVTVTKGEPMPPTPKSGQRYMLVDPTKNKSGRG